MKDEIINYLKEKNIEIPSGDNEIANLFLGTLITGQVDYWLDWSSDFIDDPKPSEPYEREWSEIAKQDKAYRTSFAHLDSEAKSQLKRLLKESLEGVVFSILTRIDSCPVGEWKIELKTKDMKGIANAESELHEDLYSWISMFGENEVDK